MNINWQILKDIGEVAENFSEAKDLLIYKDGEVKAVVEGKVFPFVMRATFEGDGVARIEAEYDHKRYSVDVYDSHGSKNPSEKFYMVCKSVYEEASEYLIEEIFNSDTDVAVVASEEVEWARKFQLYLLRKTSTKLANMVENDKPMIGYLAKRIKNQASILNNIPSI